MCEVFQEIYDEGYRKGYEIGYEIGIEIGVQQTRLEHAKNLMANLGVTAEVALDLLGIPESEHAHYLAMLYPTWQHYGGTSRASRRVLPRT